MPESTSPLLVLNASAGSGKTYSLVKQYMKMVLADSANVLQFSQIIAMTFTNKASLEMKTRILKALDELSHPAIYGKKSTDYAEELASEMGLTAEEVHNRARRVLKNVLHRYEDLFVMTIDKFNLRLIRSFSRDLDLPNDFEVILNEREVIEEVVDLLLEQLGDQGVQELTDTVFEYAKSNLDEGERWNFRDQLVEFGKVLSKERDQLLIAKLMGMDFSPQRRRELRAEFRDLEDEFLARVKEVSDRYEQLNLSDDLLPGKSTTGKALRKLGGITSFPDSLFTSSFIEKQCEVEPPVGRVFPEDLRNSCIDLQNEFDALLPRLGVMGAFLKNFYNMSLLQFMARSLDGIKKDKQLIRISEFNTLISQLVRGEEAPFIYERLGSRFHHFLLDEFQDTSRLQWLNMVPLVHESLSHERRNLIVGDPKQSIYRFKNGVAEQFVALPRIFNPEKEAKIEEWSQFFEDMGEVEPLASNWRSSREIVELNNSFFKILRDHLPEQSKDFYQTIKQKVVSEKDGYVEIISEPGDTPAIDKVPQIIEWIEQCEADGFKRGDICILSEVNDKANIWAVELTKKGYKVVSSESLLIQNEVRVKLIVSFIRRRLNPSSESEKRKFAELYFRISRGLGYNEYKKYLERKVSAKGKNYTLFDDAQFLIDYFGGRDNFFFRYENLYDLITQFYTLMGWTELNNPYLHHFTDAAHSFELNRGPELKDFLNYYEENKGRLAIQLPESEDAIRIMTIHKSKGLEFPVVIIPDVDFSIKLKSQSKFLVEAGEYILYTTLKKTHPAPEVCIMNESETAQILTDKVNLAYVGMTRPEERLYIINQHKDSNLGSVLHDCFQNLPGLEVNAEGHLIKGARTQRPPKPTKGGGIGFLIPEELTDRLWFPDISLQDRSELIDANLLTDEQRFGNQFHALMAELNSSDQIELTIQRMVAEGLLELGFVDQLTEKAEQIFNHPAYASLFTGSTRILSERSIILDEMSTVRPDKIICKSAETIVRSPSNEVLLPLHV
ncbi:MAG: UvrD-helicase domain-containing protein [Cryomorphaceae bacterium]|nr:UvrD-helicase domain-containing protein [Cryomorphaceae bacterium]